MLRLFTLLAMQTLTLPTVPTMENIVGVKEALVGLSLEDAVGMALVKNTDLRIAQNNRRIARYQIIAAQGAYDLRFTIAPNYAYDEEAVTNPFFSGPNGLPVQQSIFGTSAGLSEHTLGGTTYTVSASASRTDDNTGINSFDPTYATAFALDVRQPLLRGAGNDESKHTLELARAGGELSTDQLLLTASDTLVNVLDTYYDLIAAWRTVAIQEDALRQTKAQSESNQRLVARGAAAPMDIAESNAQVDVFRNNVSSSLREVARLQNQLKRLTLANPADPLWLANIVPSSSVSNIPAEPMLDDIITSALRDRPEMQQLQASRESADADLAYARSQVKPQLDLHLGVTENGFAGAPVNPAGSLLASFPSLPLPPYETGKLGQAWSNAFAGRFPQYALGATIGLPLGNRAARGDLGAARTKENVIDTQRVALIQRIIAESRNAVQSFRSARERLIAASAEREAAERVLQGEQRKFSNGQSTTFLVLQREVSVANARGSELQAQTDLQEALVELDRVSGAIFTRYGVDVAKLGEGS
jgi:outer membrane protein